MGQLGARDFGFEGAQGSMMNSNSDHAFQVRPHAKCIPFAQLYPLPLRLDHTETLSPTVPITFAHRSDPFLRSVSVSPHIIFGPYIFEPIKSLLAYPTFDNIFSFFHSSSPLLYTCDTAHRLVSDNAA